MFYILFMVIAMFVLCFAIWFKNKEINSPILIFNFMSLIITIIANINLDNSSFRNITLEYVNICIFLLVLAMNFGFMIFMPSSKINKKGMVKNSNYTINKKKVKILTLGIILILIIVFRDSIFHILAGNLNAIRQSIYYSEVGSENSIYGNGVEVVIVQWFINAVIPAIYIVTTVFSLKLGGNFKLYGFTLLSGIIYSVLTGGRMMIFRLFIISLISLIVVKGDKSKDYISTLRSKFLNKRKKKLSFTIIILIVLTIVITLSREEQVSITDNELYQSIADYLISPILYFAHLLDSNINDMNPLLGGAFFGGINQVFNIFWENLSGYEITVPYELIVEETSTFLLIQPNKMYNAFPTMLYSFYRDLGLLGIILGSLILAFFISYTYKKYIMENDIRATSLYIFAIYILVMGILRWEPTYIQPWITYICIYIVTNKNNKGEKFEY